jgi:pectate lyase
MEEAMRNRGRVSKTILVIGCTVLFIGSMASSVCAVDFSLKGFASAGGGTSGGTGGTVTTATTVAQLDAFASAASKNTTPRILNIKGKISYSGTPGYVIAIKRSSNITIQGDPSGGELQNIGINLVDDTNVIVQNLYIHEVFYDSDDLTIDGCSHVWVTRCEMHSKMGADVTMDTYDGLLDVKKGSEYVTISWCALHDHMKCSLIGHSDNEGQKEMDSNIKVTYHHNWFSNTDGRNPSIRFGVVHMYNNIYENISDYGLAARNGAHAKVENCIYRNVVKSMGTNLFIDPDGSQYAGFICQSGNEITNSGAPSITQDGCSFWTSSTLPYSYTPEALTVFEPVVRANAGVPGKPVSVNNYVTSKEIKTRNQVVIVNQNSLHVESADQISNITITDISGRVVSKHTTNSQHADIGIAAIANGVYNIKVETASGIITKQMIK